MSGKKLIAFDLDGTLAPSKSPIPKQIAEMLAYLLERYQVCIISGGNYPQFKKQILEHLKSPFLHRLHLMPTSGTKYYTFDVSSQKWIEQYNEVLPPDEVYDITESIKETIDILGMEFPQRWGKQIENRGSQITFSALGQEAPVEEKERWDPDNSKRMAMLPWLNKFLPDMEVRIGGTTSLDITRKGIDKSYGMNRLLSILNLSKEDVLYFGDKLDPGGNDYPIRAMGINCVGVIHWSDTCMFVRDNL